MIEIAHYEEEKRMVLSSPGVYCGDDWIECLLWGRFNEAPKRASVGPDGALEPGRLLWGRLH